MRRRKRANGAERQMGVEESATQTWNWRESRVLERSGTLMKQLRDPAKAGAGRDGRAAVECNT
ncbi:uncharacterized protein ColSpa_04959 [Colletotrichum spaethianum]|uniref:Uncharacterized protein n=1 Tax=Colletotrichum spaethianum TaxID=700344 RepID=A0AA37LE69_9PEZI|nr:uncharacterized protein ColSpa_04959 [Colletotrichum spaethianum]GKT44778.1 hypothetical protein ColSpa_04959 [Colletotrichum spaethianum]